MSIIELEKSLSDLHKELTRLTPALKLAEKAVETVELAKAIPERHKQLIKELKSVFVNPEESDKEEYVNVYTCITNLLTELEVVKNTINKYVNRIYNLIQYLENNDIPKKLESINFQLTNLNNSLLSLQEQINTVQSTLIVISNLVNEIKQNSEKILVDVNNLKEELKDKIKKIENVTLQKFHDIESRLDKQDKVLKTIKSILLIICGLIVIGFVTTIFIALK